MFQLAASKRQRITLGTAGLLIAGLSLAACTGPPNSNSLEHQAANAGIDLMLTNQPVPIFATSALRANAIEVEAIQSLGSPTTTFFFPEGTVIMANGKYSAPPFKICPSQGEPIHSTDSVTNPQQVTTNNAVVNQMDPNGIYPGDSAGTNVLCLNAQGKQEISYWEGPVETESGTAVWNAAGGPGQQIQDVGPSMLPVCTLTHASPGDGTRLATGTTYYHCVKA